MKIRWLPRTWELPDAIKLRLGETVGKQRSMLEEDHLLIILHAPPHPDQETREARAFWRAPDGTWKSNFGKGPTGLSEHIAEFNALLDEADKSSLEATNASDYFEVIEKVTPLYRAARNMHRALQQAREYVPMDQQLISRRDDAYGVERTAELLLADTKNALDLYVARQTEAMTQSGHSMALAGHRLNVLAAMFFPTATLAAVLGMNLPSGLENVSPPLPFFGVLVTGVLMGFTVKSWLGSDTVSPGGVKTGARKSSR